MRHDSGTVQGFQVTRAGRACLHHVAGSNVGPWCQIQLLYTGRMQHLIIPGVTELVSTRCPFRSCSSLADARTIALPTL